MFFAAGVGAYGAAMFHLLTHAFFKALLFLGAGSVIHAMHHEQDMRYYGALRKEIPITFVTMLLGTLAITGVGIPGTIFGFAGFFSKDAILESAFAAGGHGTGAFYVGIFAALLTSFYSWRLMFLTFWGKPRWAGSEHIQHAAHGDHHDHPDEEDASHAVDHAHGHGHAVEGTAGYHPHESPWTMLLPLILLSVGAVFGGFAFHHAFVDPEGGTHFWAASTLFFNEHLMHASHEVPTWVKWSPFAVMATGFVVAWLAYIRYTDWPARFVAQFYVLYDFLLHKWYFDELYDLIFVRPAFWLGRLFWKGGDEGTIDRFGPNGMAAVVVAGGRVTRALQSGYLYSYALVMLIGLVAAATWAIMPK
jgi:NADH-quinone oxidoreductase subunit L